MKITGIDIGKYRQFKNIKFDFTYPEGHVKAGQPLDKVCFIGQSGTGKTTLLNIIWDFFLIIDDAFQTTNSNQLYTEITQPYYTFKDIEMSASSNKNIFKFKKNMSTNEHSLFKYTNKDILEWLNEYDLIEELANSKKMALYLDDSVINQVAYLTKNRNEKNLEDRPLFSSVNDAIIQRERKVDLFKKIKNSKVLNISLTDSEHLWEYLLEDIDMYDKSLTKIVQNLVNNVGAVSKNRLFKDIEKWQSENSNPKINIAQSCLNPILSNFFLEVDVDAAEALILLKTISGIQLSSNRLSTGAKQILATVIPIYKSQINDGVILFDEPERSLFPDIQRALIAYYVSLAPQAQFFFATHSPIIASAFEPCERFVLFFNENGDVDYHTGIAPEGDDPNDILRQDFDMAELMLQKGLEAYEQYRQLAMQIRAETDEEKKNQLIAKRVELGNRYNF